MNRRAIGIIAAIGYLATIVAANWFVQHVGTRSFPGGPHTIPVGFGYQAPSGVLWIGLAFTLRDFVQRELGKIAVVVAILIGAALSWIVAPSLAVASATAFLLGEAVDFGVYTPLIDRGKTLAAIGLSNIAGLLIDTFVFLWLAFHSLQFWQGQVLGKLYMTILAIAVIVPVRRAVLARH